MTEELWSEAWTFPPVERAKLAQALLSLHDRADANPKAAWLEELDRRAQRKRLPMIRLRASPGTTRERIPARLKGAPRGSTWPPGEGSSIARANARDDLTPRVASFSFRAGCTTPCLSTWSTGA
jgi:hypothetical protein